MDLLTVGDVAGRLRVKPQLVERQARAGLLPGHKVGRFWRFTEADVDTYLERVRTGATTPQADPFAAEPQRRRRRPAA